MTSPYKPLGHKRSCQCDQCKLVREWEREKKELLNIVASKPLYHCPKDCRDAKTCHRGQPLPVDKRICYVPKTSVRS
jgi:hypothetical protein